MHLQNLNRLGKKACTSEAHIRQISKPATIRHISFQHLPACLATVDESLMSVSKWLQEHAKQNGSSLMQEAEWAWQGYRSIRMRHCSSQRVSSCLTARGRE